MMSARQYVKSCLSVVRDATVVCARNRFNVTVVAARCYGDDLRYNANMGNGERARCVTSFYNQSAIDAAAAKVLYLFICKYILKCMKLIHTYQNLTKA